MSAQAILRLLGYTGEEGWDYIEATGSHAALFLVYQRLSYANIFLVAYEIRTSGVVTDYLLKSVARCPYPAVLN
jgi:hypothetical protein